MYAILLEHYVFFVYIFIALPTLCWFYSSTQLVHTGRCLQLNSLRLTETHKVKVTNAFLQIHWKYTTKFVFFFFFSFFLLHFKTLGLFCIRVLLLVVLIWHRTVADRPTHTIKNDSHAKFCCLLFRCRRRLFEPTAVKESARNWMYMQNKKTKKNKNHCHIK